MHPRLAELLAYAGVQRQVLLAAVESVPPARRGGRPGEGVWSVAEVLEHLCRTESGIASLITKRLAEARAAGLERDEEVSSVLGVLDRYGIDRGTRLVRAPEVVQPTGAWSWSEALERLGASRAAFERAAAAGDGYALGQVTHPHPLIGPLTLYQWILFVGQHEARHAAQIRQGAAGMA